MSIGNGGRSPIHCHFRDEVTGSGWTSPAHHEVILFPFASTSVDGFSLKTISSGRNEKFPAASRNSWRNRWVAEWTLLARKSFVRNSGSGLEARKPLKFFVVT